MRLLYNGKDVVFLHSEVPSTFDKVDNLVFKIIKYVSYISGVCLVAIMLIAFFNVIGEKLARLAVDMGWAWFPSFIKGIPQSTEYIQYLHIPVVFLAAAYVTLDRGHTAIDMLSSHFPQAVQKALTILGNVLGAAVTGFIAYRGFFELVPKQISTFAKISTSSFAAPLWPFGVIHSVGFLLMAVSFVWAVVRVLAGRSATNPPPPPPGTELTEGGEQP